MKIKFYLVLFFSLISVFGFSQTTSYYVTIHFAAPPGIYCDYMSNWTKMVGTISSADGSNSVSFSVDQTNSVKVNLPDALDGYKFKGNVQTYNSTTKVWTTCTSISGTSGTAYLATNYQISQYLPELGISTSYVNFDYCWSPVEKQSFLVTGGNYDEYLTISKIQYTNSPLTWQVSLNATTWYSITMPTASNGYIPETGSVGPYYLIDRDRLRNVLGSTFYGKPIYFRSTHTNVCFNSTSDPSISVKLYALKPTVTLISPEDVKCKGESTGTVTVNISHPDVDRFIITCKNLDNSAYTFQIPAAYSGDNLITGLRAGKWQFLVENNNSVNASDYGAATTTIDHTVGEPVLVLTAAMSAKKYKTFDVSCNGGADGEITASATGGNGGYTYTWDHDAGLTTAIASGLTAKTYGVTVTDSKGCINKSSLTLTEPIKLSVAIVSTGGKGAYEVSCWNKQDGAIQATATGGASGYTYTWSTGVTTDKISGLGTNNYSVTIMDANSCTAASSIILTAPPKIDFTINELVKLICPDDKTAVLEAKPVTSTIIGKAYYSWSSGETTATIQDKGADTYTVTVSDDQGCSTEKSITLTNPQPNTVSIVPQSNYNGSLIKCNGDSNGSLAAIVKDENNNTITAQNYLWTENGTTIGESATLASVNNLNEGLYKVVITYRTQCKAEVTYFLSDPEPVAVTVSATTNYNGQAISCYNQTDAKLLATAAGGTGTLSYVWGTGTTGSMLSNIGAGSYTVTVKDVNGCTGTGSATLQNPEPVQALITDVSDYSGYGVSCYGVSDGTITSEGSGGTGVYTYAWSNGKTTAAITGLAAGDYTLTVSDNNNCKQSVGQTITTPAALSLAIADQKNISCFDGSDGTIELQSSGGTGTYTYSKDNATTWQTENIFSALKQGSYTILLRDGNSCTKNISSTLTQPTKINISFTNIEPAFCGNPAGTATAVVTGGVSGYTYSWQDSKANVVDTDATLSNAKGGIYTVNVTDNNACPMSNSVGITSTDGAKSTYTSTAAKCFDSSDGSAAITITEGDGPFIIEWPDGQNTLQGVNLKKNQYDVLITDGHNCTVVQTVEVSAPDALQLSVKNKTVPTCNGSCDGQLTLEATGGVANYSYEWNGKTGATQTQLCTGTYPVIVKDANACILTMDVKLEQPDPIEIKVANSTLATCKDGCDGSLEIAVTGGNGGYSYTWAAGGDTNIETNICPGSYGVTVTDVKNCKGTSVATLENTPALPLDLGGGVTLCVGQTYSLDAGPGWVSTKWGGNTGFTSTDQKITLKEAGNYWVEVLSDKGCVAQDTFLLETSYDLLKAALLIRDEAAVGDTVVMIDVSWPLPEKVEWNYPTEMTEVLNLGDAVFGQFDKEGIYEVSLTAHLGECVDKISEKITIRKDDAASAGGRLGYEEFVKEFTLYPNPNNGLFDVGVELAEESAVTISVWNSPTGIMIKQVQRSGNKIYKMSFDLRPLSSGTYVLRLDHAKGKEYLRFIVN